MFQYIIITSFMTVFLKNIIFPNMKTCDNYPKYLFNNQKLISVSPCGFKGFYLLGTLTYMKDNYDLSNCIFSGASAGAWCSLIMTLKQNFDLPKFIIETNIVNQTSIFEMEQIIKNQMLISYKDTDFALDKLFIGVTNIEKYKYTHKKFNTVRNSQNIS